MKVVIYTDGACSYNPGPGGYAFIIKWHGGNKISSGGEKNTTNNRMELKGVICALHEMYKMIVKYGKLSDVEEIQIISDSSYIINAINQNWIGLWQKNGWVNSKNKSVKNVDLWIEMKNYIDKIINEGKVKEIKFIKVKGHDGVLLNERCDKLARKEAMKIKNEMKGF